MTLDRYDHLFPRPKDTFAGRQVLSACLRRIAS
jgi:hypothetical protein